MSILKDLFIEEYDELCAEAKKAGVPIDKNKLTKKAYSRSIDRFTDMCDAAKDRAAPEEEKLHKAFKAKALAEGYELAYICDLHPTKYYESDTQIAWEFYQAGAAYQNITLQSENARLREGLEKVSALLCKASPNGYEHYTSTSANSKCELFCEALVVINQLLLNSNPESGV